MDLERQSRFTKEYSSLVLMYFKDRSDIDFAEVFDSVFTMNNLHKASVSVIILTSVYRDV